MRTEAGSRPPSAIRGLMHRCQAILRVVAGMPNYEEYLRHLRIHHPTVPIPSEQEYFESFLAARHGRGISRCC